MQSMTTPPLVSVIIPCYKQAQYLPEAIDSVLKQTYPHVEIVVVNDGSPDDTESVANAYGDRIRYVWRPNGGISAARNTGIAHATGAYLKFLDADDYVHPDQIQWQMEALAGRDNAVSFTGCRLFRDGHPEQYIDHVPRAKNLLPDLFDDLDWGSIHSYLFPRKLIEAVGGFAEGVHHAEDWYCFCQVGLLDPVFLPEPRIGSYYRLRPRSASSDRTAWIRSQARLTILLHDTLRQRGRRDWFGRSLLRFEQGIYQSLVQMRIRDRELLDGLLERIKELQAREGFGRYGWRFRLLARVLGYARAERLRAFVVRMFKIRPPETLDTAAWRQNG
jgi:glycosyltransferase involved in cell wall biosynthesis